MSQDRSDCFVIESGEIGAPDYLIGSLIRLSINLLWVDGKSHKVAESEVLYFDNSSSLYSYFRCGYDLSVFQGSKEIIVEKYTAKRSRLSRETILIWAKDRGDVLLIVKGYVYNIRPCTLDDQCLHVACLPSIFDNHITEIPTRPDSVHIYIVEPILDTVVEEVLIKEAYTEIEIVPAKFDTFLLSIITEEKLLCAEYEVIYDTSEIEVIIRDPYSILESKLAVFETVTEVVLVGEAHRYVDTISVGAKDSVYTLIVKPTHRVWSVDRIIENCHSDDPFDCVMLLHDTIETKTISVKAKVAMPCPPGFEQAGVYCYAYHIAPASYEERDYEKLVTLASTETISQDAEIATRQSIIISNKENIPDSCIKKVRDTLQQFKLVKPSTTLITEYDHQYEERYYMKLVARGDIEIDTIRSYSSSYPLLSLVEDSEKKVSPHYCDDDLTPRQINIIINSLNSLGYTIPNGASYGDADFWKAIVQYQIDHNLAIGKITYELLESLIIE